MCDYRSYQPTPEEQEEHEPIDDPTDPLKNWKMHPAKKHREMEFIEDTMR